MTRKNQVAFGPELPEFGSWNWLAIDLITALSPEFEIASFQTAIPPAETVVFFKFLPRQEVLEQVAQRSRIVFCPVDIYGSAAEIDADSERFRFCHRVVVHCDRLARYIRGYAPVVSLEHHVKYVTSIPDTRPADGPFLWVVASRLGGLPFTVLDESTGLLCEAGDPEDLARQLIRLIDDPRLRQRLGTQGRQRFESTYQWSVILERHYLPLLGPPVPAVVGVGGTSEIVRGIEHLAMPDLSRQFFQRQFARGGLCVKM